MGLQAGTRLATYEIVAPLGAGGMGEVYRARDTKLNREVALKVVPETFAADPIALARFQNEAQAIAALSHPNIVSIFDVGVDRVPYAVMELLDGETLRQRLQGGALPTRKAIEYATQIASGLAAAHARGITHRDLKPENIVITRDGRVKILDFGLAKSGPVAPASNAGATFEATVHVTSPGTVLGTVGYMSPEQVRGHVVDHRSDIFSLGAVLYEMLAGRRAFSGDSSVETMNAILKTDPEELTRANATLSPALDRIVRRCLEKNPDERFQSARDLGFAFEAVSGSSVSTATALPGVVTTERRWLRPAVAAATGLVALGLAFVAGRSTVTRVGSSALTFETKTFDPQTIFNARFAPDGQTIVFSAALEGNSPELFVSRTGAVAPQSLKLPRTHLLSVSSKGELAVLTDAVTVGQRLFRGTLARMPVDGSPRPWMEGVREADWSPDGSTLAIIHVVGREDQLEYPPGKVIHRSTGYLSDVRVSPDGNRVAFFEHPVRNFDDRGFVRLADRDGTIRTLAGEYWGLEGLTWTHDGSTVLYSGAEAGMEGYQPRAVSTSGNPGARLALPSAGSVLVLDASRDDHWLITRQDTQLSIRARLPGTNVEREFAWLGGAIRPRVSPDGGFLLFEDESQAAGRNYAVSVRKTDGSPAVRLGEGTAVALSPDGKLALSQIFDPPSIVVYPIGPGEPIRLKTGSIEKAEPRLWMPDSKHVVVCGFEPSRQFRCYELDLVGGPPKPLTPEGFDVGPVSPDGRRIVISMPDRVPQIYSLGESAGRPLSSIKPEEVVAAWSLDGRSLFVTPLVDVPARIDRVDIDTGRRTTVRELAPPDRTGVVSVFFVDLRDDGETYAYSYWKQLSKLFVVKGASLR